MTEPVHFLTKNFGRYDTSSIGSYMRIGGFEALRKAVNTDPKEITDLISSVKSAWPRRRRVRTRGASGARRVRRGRTQSGHLQCR